ncbi:hypothetical protein PISMIDRAFT_19587 [Pisolithus microcarpus 441]|uniref:Uncharacterized protein n=1 Tax=Pisolithus microcarpus 441 TaxID=765257 RepID=A0A0C9YM21_9AGAM|nr:hypothetical protein PISMIDRAFT_19587 [Pisolithus microcarpus 441]
MIDESAAIRYANTGGQETNNVTDSTNMMDESGQYGRQAPMHRDETDRLELWDRTYYEGPADISLAFAAMSKS